MASEGTKVRMVDIAQRLSVSPATVSLAIHNKPGVSDKVRADVLKACEELGYSLEKENKNQSPVRRLIRLAIYKKDGQTIGDTPFFAELIEGIENEAKLKGYELLISYYNKKSDLDDVLNRIVNNDDVAGLILLATEMSVEDLEPFAGLECPLVVLDNFFNKTDIMADYVLIDNVNGMYNMTECMIANGNKTIGYVKSASEINNYKERMNGYRMALADYGVPYEQKYVFEVGAGFDTAYEGMLHWLNMGHEIPDALVVDNDLICYGVMKALNEKGIRVPEDVSIGGFDEMSYFGLEEIGLSTVRVYKRAMGQTAVRQLVQDIEDEQRNEKDYSVVIRMRTELVKKNSIKSLVLP